MSFKRLVTTPASLLLLAAGMTLLSTPATTQGSREPQSVPSWARGSDIRCPSGWTLRGATCHANGPNAPRIFPRASANTACPTGFGAFSGMPFCIEGEDSRLARDASGTITKANRLDRCPFGYYTNVQAPTTCITNSQNPPTVRLKGSGQCRAGEVEDWGIYCISNYAGVSRDAATGYATRDWNAIYSTNNATPPRQPDTPEGTQYTPAYLTIFGRVTASGAPIGGGAAPAPAAQSASATTRPASTTARTGSLNPQARTAVSFLCPQGWIAGQPGTGRNPDLCYPDQGATPAYPRTSEDEACAAGYVLSSTWCAQGSYGLTTQQMAAGQQPAAPAQPQTPANCPDPQQAANAGAQAGAALGGLLGGRRGNSQAGAAVGGLLGQAAANASQRPAGCP